jgi:hypothetical protein
VFTLIILRPMQIKLRKLCHYTGKCQAKKLRHLTLDAEEVIEQHKFTHAITKHASTAPRWEELTSTKMISSTRSPYKQEIPFWVAPYKNSYARLTKTCGSTIYTCLWLEEPKGFHRTEHRIQENGYSSGRWGRMREDHVDKCKWESIFWL